MCGFKLVYPIGMTSYSMLFKARYNPSPKVHTLEVQLEASGEVSRAEQRIMMLTAVPNMLFTSVTGLLLKGEYPDVGLLPVWPDANCWAALYRIWPEEPGVGLLTLTHQTPLDFGLSRFMFRLGVADKPVLEALIAAVNQYLVRGTQLPERTEILSGAL